jgi:hypothetical protein
MLSTFTHLIHIFGSIVQWIISKIHCFLIGLEWSSFCLEMVCYHHQGRLFRACINSFFNSLHIIGDLLDVFFNNASLLIIFFKFIDRLYSFYGTSLMTKFVLSFPLSTFIFFNLLQQSLIPNIFSCPGHFFYSYVHHPSSVALPTGHGTTRPTVYHFIPHILMNEESLKARFIRR